MEDEDGEVERCCRICRGPEEEEVDGEEAGEALGKLIRPCACKGSLLYVHEKCQEMWIKTYIRRSDKKPACEVCGQQFRISFTQPHKGLAGFLFSSQSPPLVHAIYLSLLYIGLYCLFLFAAEHHTKLAAFCVMVAVAVGASAAIFYLIAFREVDRQVLVYYIDLEYKAFLQQLTWKSSMGVLLEGISSTSIVLNIGLLLCVSSVRLYNFLRHLRRHGGSLANVWMTAPDSTRATIIGSVQLCIFCWFYVCGPTGKCAVFLVYVAFVAAVNWLLRSQFSRNVDTGLCRLALAMGYGFVGTVLAGIGITHYLALLADADVEASSAANSAALSVPMDQLAGETQEEAEVAEELAATQQHSGDDVVDELAHATAEHGPGFPFSFHPTLMSRKMAGNFVRFLYDKSARDDHYEYWNQVYYVSFFLFQTLGIFGVAIWVHVRAVWDHFKDWQNVRRQQQLMLLRDELLFKLNGMEQQHRTLVDSVRNNQPARNADPLAAAQPAPAPASPGGGDEPTYGDVHAHLRRRQQLDREPRLAPTDQVDLATREAETALRRVQSNLGHLEDSEEEELEEEEELYGAEEGNEEEEHPSELGNEEEFEEVDGGEADVDVDTFTREAAEKGKEKVDTDAEADDEVGQATAATSASSPPATAQGAPLDAAAATAAAADEDEIGNRLQAGAREFVSGVRSIDELVTQYLRERRTESQAGLFAQYLRAHLSPFTAPEKVRMVYATLAYLVLFNSVYFSLVVIDQDEVRKVWLRYVMDCVGMISILFFVHFNYLTGAPNHNFNILNVDHNARNRPNANNDNDDGENRNNGNNAGRNYGLLLIGHAVLYFVLLFAWIVLRPATFFDPSLRLSHDAAAAGVDVVSDTNGATADAASDEYASELPADLVDALLMEPSGAVAVDPYTLHSLKVVSLLLFVSIVEYGLIGLGLTARRLVRIYRIWLNTGTGHFVVHDIAEPGDAGAPAPPQPQQPLPPQQRRDEDEREREAEEHEEEAEAQRLRRRRTAAAGAE